MSKHNTTDQWASMIINELVEEAGALEKTPKHERIYDKEAYIEKYDFDPSNVRFARYEFENFEDDLDDHYKGSIEKQDTSVNFCENVSKTEVVRSKNDEDVFQTVQNLTKNHNLKCNNEMIKDITEIATNSSEKTTDKEVKSDGVCTVEKTENFRDHVNLIDLNEAFIQCRERHSGKTEDHETNRRLTHSMEKINEPYTFYHKKSLSSFSLDAFHSEYEEKKHNHFYKFGNKISKNVFEKPYSYYQNVNFPEKIRAINNDLYFLESKTKHYANNMLSVNSDFETDIKNVEEYDNRKDEESELTECGNLIKEENRNDEQVNEDIYAIDQAVPHLKLSNELIRNMHLVINCSKSVSNNNSKDFTDKLMERDNVKETPNIVTAAESSENVELNNEFVFDEITVGEEHASYACSEGKNKFKNTNEKIIEINNPSLVEINNEATQVKERCFKMFGRPENYRCNKPGAKEIRLDKSNVNVGQKTRENDTEDKTVSNINNSDSEEINIRNQRANFVITKYRTMCVKFEVIFVKPFANVLADSYELISFIFFLIVCVFYMIFDRLQFLISNFRLPKKSPDSSDEKRNMAINSGKPILSVITDRMIIYENNLLSNDETTVEKISPERNEEIEKCIDIKSWIQVAPEEIEVIALNYEIANEKLVNLYEELKNAFPILCCREQHRALIKTCAEFQVDFEFINDNQDGKEELSVPDFDEEIISSSKRLGCGINGTSEREIDDSCIIVKFLKHNSKLSSKIKNNANSVLSDIFSDNSGSDSKPLFNSTAVDVLDTESNSKLRCSSSSDVSLASYVTSPESRSFKMQVSRRNSPERCYLTSSLTVNLPSFASRSDLLSESAPSMATSRSFRADERMESADEILIHTGVKRGDINEHFLSSRSLPVSAAESFRKSSIFVAKSNIKREVVKHSVVSNFNEKSSNLKQTSYTLRQNSGIFSNSDSVDVSSKENNRSKKSSLMSGDTKFISVLSNSNCEKHSIIKQETSLIVMEENSKRRSSLRRRASSILDRWRNMQVMPSCVKKNSKCVRDSHRNDTKKR